MFVDEALIAVKAGDGGNGCVAFRREKFVPNGGPSGGDGGSGGSVVLRSSERHNTLFHFKFRSDHIASRGRHGEGSNRTGRSGRDSILEVPAGTVVYDADTGERVFDFEHLGQEFVAARGGNGGRGNARFTRATNQAPRRSEPGIPGEERRLRLELKLLADVGLIGYPNAGKSTLISRISSARPKIADYPFTTLQPNLGVVTVNQFDSFLVADIPGLMKGANLGQGLGIRFLRHIERTRLLVHLIEMSDVRQNDPVDDYHVIRKELACFSRTLLQKPMVVVASKIDTLQDSSKADRLQRFCENEKLPFFRTSVVTGEGFDRLKSYLGLRVLGFRGSPIEEK